MRVWFASAGEYSDYRVRHVFASRAVAQAYVDSLGEEGYGAPFVEPDNDEGFLVRDDHGTVKVQLRKFAVIKRNGLVPDTSRTQKHSHSTLDEEPFHLSVQAQRYTAIFEPQINIYVYGFDHERVNKVYSDTVARCIAEFDVMIEGVTPTPV